MKLSKRVFVILLILVFSLSIIGCKKKKKNEEKVTLTLSQVTLSLKAGDKYTLTVSVTPSSRSSDEVSWSTSNDQVVTVNKGVLDAKKAGSATITAKLDDVEAKCNVTVTEEVVSKNKEIEDNAKGLLGFMLKLPDEKASASNISLEGVDIYTITITNSTTDLATYISSVEAQFTSNGFIKQNIEGVVSFTKLSSTDVISCAIYKESNVLAIAISKTPIKISTEEISKDKVEEKFSTYLKTNVLFGSWANQGKFYLEDDSLLGTFQTYEVSFAPNDNTLLTDTFIQSIATDLANSLTSIGYVKGQLETFNSPYGSYKQITLSQAYEMFNETVYNEIYVILSEYGIAISLSVNYLEEKESPAFASYNLPDDFLIIYKNAGDEEIWIARYNDKLLLKVISDDVETAYLYTQLDETDYMISEYNSVSLWEDVKENVGGNEELKVIKGNEVESEILLHFGLPCFVEEVEGNFISNEVILINKQEVYTDKHQILESSITTDIYYHNIYSSIILKLSVNNINIHEALAIDLDLSEDDFDKIVDHTYKIDISIDPPTDLIDWPETISDDLNIKTKIPTPTGDYKYGYNKYLDNDWVELISADWDSNMCKDYLLELKKVGFYQYNDNILEAYLYEDYTQVSVEFKDNDNGKSIIFRVSRSTNPFDKLPQKVMFKDTYNTVTIIDESVHVESFGIIYYYQRINGEGNKPMWDVYMYYGESWKETETVSKIADSIPSYQFITSTIDLSLFTKSGTEVYLGKTCDIYTMTNTTCLVYTDKDDHKLVLKMTSGSTSLSITEYDDTITGFGSLLLPDVNTCYHVWGLNNQGTSGTGICTKCGEHCTHTWSSGVCSICFMLCQHEKTKMVSNNDATHNEVCETCKDEIDYFDCVDHNDDNVCDDCGYKYPSCAHDNVYYESLDNGTHKKVCDDCYKTIGDPESCVDSDGDLYCDICYYQYPCEHQGEFIYYPNYDNTHSKTCGLCYETLVDSLPCEDHDNNGFCDLCDLEMNN